MGIESYLLSSSIIAVVAQRLLRVLCPHCKVPYRVTNEEAQELNLDEDYLLYQSLGCSECFGLGYKGRVGIYELMKVDTSLKKAIAKGNDLHDYKEKHMKFTLKAHARQLVIEGKTSVKELLRVIKN
jgi:general secretion pathway protein E